MAPTLEETPVQMRDLSRMGHYGRVVVLCFVAIGGGIWTTASWKSKTDEQLVALHKGQENQQKQLDRMEQKIDVLTHQVEFPGMRAEDRVLSARQDIR